MAKLVTNRKAQLVYSQGTAWLEFKRRGEAIHVQAAANLSLAVALNPKQCRKVAAWFSSAADSAEAEARAAKRKKVKG